MGFVNLQGVVDAETTASFTTFRKVPSVVTTIGIWFDLSMSSGYPKPQYYASAPLVAARMARSTDVGIDHGSLAPGQTKYLRRLMCMIASGTSVPAPLILCDYLLYYPFVDEGDTEVQTLDNTTTLSRYTDGGGVQMMAVSVAGRTGGASFTVSYTNSAGVAGRTTGPVLQNSVSVNGNIVSSHRAANTPSAGSPFLPLQQGDTGVRSIESVQMATGDVGLFTLVLVKPIANMQIREITAPVEVDFLRDFNKLPSIEADAYLNLLICPQATLSAIPAIGSIEFITK